LDPEGREDSLQRGKSQLAFKCPSLLLSQESYNNNNKKTFESQFTGGYMILGLSLVLLSKKKKKGPTDFWSNSPLLFRKVSLNNGYKKG